MIVEQHVDEDDPLSATDSAQDSPTSNEPNLESDEELQKRVEALLARAEGGSTEKVAVTDLLSFFGHKKLGRRIKVRVDEQLKARNITATQPDRYNVSDTIKQLASTDAAPAVCRPTTTSAAMVSPMVRRR